TAAIHFRAEVDRPVGRVVVVTQLALCRNDLYVVDAVVVQHLLSYVAARHAAAQRRFRIFFEFTLKTPLHNHADQHDTAENNPITYHISFYYLSLILVP